MDPGDWTRLAIFAATTIAAMAVAWGILRTRMTNVVELLKAFMKQTKEWKDALGDRVTDLEKNLAKTREEGVAVRTRLEDTFRILHSNALSLGNPGHNPGSNPGHNSSSNPGHSDNPGHNPGPSGNPGNPPPSLQALVVREHVAYSFLMYPDDEMYGEALQVLLKVTGSRYGIFGYINEKQDFVCPSLTRDVWEQCQMPNKTIVFPREDWGGLWGRALVEKKLLCSNEPFDVPQGHVPIQRAVMVPIIWQDEVIGLVELANKPTDYDAEDITLLKGTATYVAELLAARLERSNHKGALE